jgi:hypothetical protein
MYKKVLLLTSLACLVLPLGLFAQSENAKVNAESDPNQNQISTQEATMNQGEESQLQANVATQAGKEVGQQMYQAKNATAGTRSSEVAKAVLGMVSVANRISDQSIGEAIKKIAQAQGEAEDKANKAIDKMSERGEALKFFIGADYGQIKEAKKIVEQNRVRINELQQIQTKLQNVADQTEIQNQINVLEIQNLNLANQLRDESEGFTLLGWFVRWFYGV